jgi:photosystem II stability/assembly factor-like uncharacterized protein
LRIAPQTPGTIYAGTDVGLYKTTDTGATWTALNTGLPNGHYGHLISILEIDPQAPGTIYVSDTCCQEIYRSTDGGATWAGTLARDSSGLIVRGVRLNINAFAIDPRNPRTLYATGSFGQSGQPAGGRGAFKSADGGASWTLVNAGLPDASNCCGSSASLAIDPQNPLTLYVGTWYGGGGAIGDGVFKTTNGGLSWKGVGLAGHSRVDVLAVDPQNPNILYARTSDFASCCRTSHLYKTTNGGGNWIAADAGISAYVNAIAIDPQHSGTVYAGTDSGVYRSADGGTNWAAINSGLPSLAVTALAIDPLNSSRVYAGAADGVYATMSE